MKTWLHCYTWDHKHNISKLISYFNTKSILIDFKRKNKNYKPMTLLFPKTQIIEK